MSRNRILDSGIRTELTRSAISNLFSLQIRCGPFTLLFAYHHHQLRHPSLPGKTSNQHVISGFRRLFKEIFALLRSYAAYIGCRSSTFRGKLPVPPSRVKKEREDLVHTAAEAWNRARHKPVRRTLYVTLRDSIRADWSMKIGRTGCPETSVSDRKFTMCNIPEEGKFW